MDKRNQQLSVFATGAPLARLFLLCSSVSCCGSAPQPTSAGVQA